MSMKPIYMLLIQLLWLQSVASNVTDISKIPVNKHSQPTLVLKYQTKHTRTVGFQYTLSFPLYDRSLQLSFTKPNKMRFENAPAKLQTRFTSVRHVDYTSILEKNRVYLATKEALKNKNF